MGDAGIFTDERVELLDGTIVTMCPHTSPHAATVDQLHRLLIRAVDESLRVRAQLPIVLDDWSEPEPDLAVCAPDPHRYAREHPRAANVLLVCEVAGSSLAYDRTAKAAAYAGSGIREYWIIDLEARCVHVHADPDPHARSYQRIDTVGERAALRAPGGAPIAVADVLPPR